MLWNVATTLPEVRYPPAGWDTVEVNAEDAKFECIASGNQPKTKLIMMFPNTVRINSSVPDCCLVLN